MKFIFVSFAFLCISGCTGLRLLSYHIPAVIDFREAAVLTCEFDPEGQTLHAVRWLLNGTEFFRASLQGNTARYVEGVSVQMHRSNMTSVVLAPLYFTTSGEYRCEATTRPPLHRSLSISKTMVVVALPKEGPSIEGIQGRHTWGEKLPLNCTSSPSYPPAEITWTIQDVPIPDYEIATYEDVRETGLRIRSTKSGVIIPTDRLPFGLDEEVTVSCIAYVSGIYKNTVSLRLAKAKKVV